MIHSVGIESSRWQITIIQYQFDYSETSRNKASMHICPCIYAPTVAWLKAFAITFSKFTTDKPLVGIDLWAHKRVLDFNWYVRVFF